MAKAKPHALIVPLALQGHMNPLLELSKQLLSAGFLVTFANTQANHERITKFLDQQIKDNGDAVSLCSEKPLQVGGCNADGVAVLSAERYVGFLPQSESTSESLGSSLGDGILQLRLMSLEDALPTRFPNHVNVAQAAISQQMKAAVETLVSKLLQEEHPVTCVVSDFRLLFVQDIAHKRALPHLAFWTQAAANFISNLMLAQGFQPPSDDSTLITSIPGVPPHKRSEVSALYFHDGVRCPSLSGEYLWQPFIRTKWPEWVVIHTYEQLEADILDALQENLGFRPLTFGPLVGTPMFSVVEGITGHPGEHKDSPLKWLQGHPPASVLYVAFGTVATMSREQLEELVIGLEASQQPFLWVFRPDLCKDLGHSTVSSLLERLENQAIVVPWAPQWHILCHPSVGGFLTHCGWNSTLEAIKAGVPMLGWPHIADQFVNLRCIEEKWGNGLGLKANDRNGGLVLRAEVENKVRKLMQGESGRQLRERAVELSIAAKGALSDGGSSSRNLDHFLEGHRKSLQDLS